MHLRRFYYRIVDIDKTKFVKLKVTFNKADNASKGVGTIMLSDTIRAVKDAEEAAAARIAEAKQTAKADIAAATAKAEEAAAKASAKARADLDKAVKAAKEDADRCVLDAKGMAKATADAGGEILKQKTAAAVKEILGGIRKQWQ